MARLETTAVAVRSRMLVRSKCKRMESSFVVIGGTSDGYGALLLCQLHQIIRLQEHGGRLGPPVVEAELSLCRLGCPHHVLGDVVEVRVVLGEIAGRIAQVPKKLEPAWWRPRPQTCRSGWPSIRADAPRPISSMSSTCHALWCR